MKKQAISFLVFILVAASILPSHALFYKKLQGDPLFQAVIPKMSMTKMLNVYNGNDDTIAAISDIHDENNVYYIQTEVSNQSFLPLDASESILIQYNGDVSDANAVFSNLIFFKEKADAEEFISSGRVNQAKAFLPNIITRQVESIQKKAIKISFRTEFSGKTGGDEIGSLPKDTRQSIYICSMPSVDETAAGKLEVLHFVNHIPYRNTVKAQLSEKVPGEE